jgi:CRP/FNR family transcriptional regulator, cyclic AMP receptor protein
MPWALREVDCFAGLSEAEIEEVTTAFETRRYTSGDSIITEDSPGDRIYLVRRGRVRLQVANPRGPDQREGMFDIVERGGLFGLSTLFGPGTPGLRAIAHSDVEVCLGEHDTLMRLLRWPQVAQNVVAQLGARILRIEQEMESLSSTTARTRLARVLHRLASESAEHTSGDELRIMAPLTHEALSRQIGVTRETVTRLLARLTADGLIRREGRRMVVTDLNRLAEELAGEHD